MKTRLFAGCKNCRSRGHAARLHIEWCKEMTWLCRGDWSVRTGPLLYDLRRQPSDRFTLIAKPFAWILVCINVSCWATRAPQFDIAPTMHISRGTWRSSHCSPRGLLMRSSGFLGAAVPDKTNSREMENRWRYLDVSMDSTWLMGVSMVDGLAIFWCGGGDAGDPTGIRYLHGLAHTEDLFSPFLMTFDIWVQIWIRNLI